MSLSKIEEYISWGLSLLKDMVSIPTVNPPGENYREFSALASEVLKSIGFNVDLIEVPREYVAKHRPEYANYPRYIVLGRYGSGEPVLHFNGHYDVVPPGFGWSKKPFEPTIEGGKIYGRGTCDMKGGIAAFLAAAKALVESRLPLKGTIEVALVPDEETGGETGTGYLVKQGLTRPNYVIIGEPSGSSVIWIGHKGGIGCLIEFHGKQAHGSAPWLGVNAFEYMVKIANRLIAEYLPILENRKSKYEYDDPRGARPTAMMGGEIRGGAKSNVVPGYCAFSLDRRVIPEERLEDVEKEIVDIVEKVSREYKEIDVNVKITGKFKPAITTPNSTLVNLAIELTKEVLGFRPRTTVCMGGLDMRYYTEIGIETITYGPGLLGTAHSADEFLTIEEFEKITKIYYLILRKVICPQM
ncbi:MAG: M20 family metallopeptidase [Desulfurococcaceae archaeon]